MSKITLYNVHVHVWIAFYNFQFCRGSFRPIRPTLCNFQLWGIFNVSNVHTGSLNLSPSSKKDRNLIHYQWIRRAKGFPLGHFTWHFIPHFILFHIPFNCYLWKSIKSSLWNFFFVCLHHGYTANCVPMMNSIVLWSSSLVPYSLWFKVLSMGQYFFEAHDTQKCP